MYPGAGAGQSANAHLLAGGRRGPVEEAIGVTAQIEAKRLLDLLRVDADLLRASQTVAQKVALEGHEVSAEHSATWADSEEGREQDRAEAPGGASAIRALWGREPSSPDLRWGA